MQIIIVLLESRRCCLHIPPAINLEGHKGPGDSSSSVGNHRMNAIDDDVILSVIEGLC